MLIDFETFIQIKSGFLMKYTLCLLSLFMLPATNHAMNHNQKQKLKHKTPYSKPLWNNPENISHGIYLAEVINIAGAPIRVSEMDFMLVDTQEELKAEIKDDNSINPRLVTSQKTYKTNKIPLSIQFNNNCEVACLKVEHLLYPQLFKILTIVRTYENNRCIIEALNDSKVIHTAQFANYYQLPKIVTRARITLTHEDFNTIEIATNTFSCR